MPRSAVALTVLAAALWAQPATAQDEPAAEPTAEEMVEVAREMYRPPGLSLSCAPGAAGEIVVCARNPDQYRVTSTIEDAIAAGEPVPMDFRERRTSSAFRHARKWAVASSSVRRLRRRP